MIVVIHLIDIYDISPNNCNYILQSTVMFNISLFYENNVYIIYKFVTTESLLFFNTFLSPIGLGDFL